MNLHSLEAIHKPFVDTAGKSLTPFYSEPFVKIDNTIWFGTQFGLAKCTPPSDTLVIYSNPYVEEDALNNGNAIIRISYDEKRKTLWLGTQYGFTAFDLISGKYVEIENPEKWHPINPEYKKYNFWDLEEAPNGTLWMAAYQSGGILSYNPDKNEWNEFLYSDDVNNPYHLGNQVLCILPLNDTTILYGSRLGLGIVDFKHKKLRPIPGYDFKKGGKLREMLVDAQGYLWITGRHSLAKSIKPVTALGRKNYIPMIVSILDGKESKKILDSGVAYKFRHRKIGLTMGVILPPGEEIFYKYKWDNKPWSKASTDSKIRLYDEFGGHHRLEFAAKVKGRDWVFSKQSVDIDIAPPFYLKDYFILKLMGALLFMGFLAGMLYNFLRKRKQKNQTETRKVVGTDGNALVESPNESPFYF